MLLLKSAAHRIKGYGDVDDIDPVHGKRRTQQHQRLGGIRLLCLLNRKYQLLGHTFIEEGDRKKRLGKCIHSLITSGRLMMNAVIHDRFIFGFIFREKTAPNDVLSDAKSHADPEGVQWHEASGNRQLDQPREQ